jgi:hypothetical protein
MFWQFPAGALLTPPNARAATSPSDHSASQAQAEYRKALAVARKADVTLRSMGFQSNWENIYHPSIGPVCMLKKATSQAPKPGLVQKMSVAIQRYNTTVTSMQSVLSAYQTFMKTVTYGPQYDEDKSEMQQYLDKLKEAKEQVDRLNGYLDRVNGPSLDALGVALNQFNMQIATVNSQQKMLVKKFTAPAAIVDTAWSGKSIPFPNPKLIGTTKISLLADNSGLVYIEDNQDDTLDGDISYMVTTRIPFSAVENAELGTPADNGRPVVILFVDMSKTQTQCTGQCPDWASSPEDSLDVVMDTAADAAHFIQYVDQRKGNK